MINISLIQSPDKIIIETSCVFRNCEEEGETPPAHEQEIKGEFNLSLGRGMARPNNKCVTNSN